MMTLLRKLGHFCFGTIRNQLIAGVACVYTVMMAVFVFHILLNQRVLILEQHTEQAAALAETLAVSAADWIAADDIADLQKIVNAQRNYQEVDFAMLADNQGLILAHTDPALVGSYLKDLPAKSRQTVMSRSLTLVDILAPCELGGRQVGWARVGVSQKIAGEKQAMLLRDGLFYILAAILIGALFVLFMVRRFTKGLYTVQQTIDAVRSGNQKVRVPVQGDNEVAGIAVEFNGMLDALQEKNVVLQSLHHRNELILNAAGEGIYGVDINGQIVFANPAAGRMLGYSTSELLFQNSHQLFHHTRADGTPYPAAECALQKSLMEGTVVRSQNEVFWARDGRMFCVEHVNTPIIEDGLVVGAVVVFRDISERKATDEAIRVSAARLAEAQRLAHLGYWEQDLVNKRLLCSDEVFRIFGMEPQESALLYQTFLARVHPEDREKVERAYAETQQKRSGYEIEYRILLPSGEIRFVQELCATESDEAGAPSRSLGTIMDVTERRRMEAQLRQSQKMESIGTLAGGIAHDFNNILTAIIGFGEIVMVQLPPDSALREEQAHVLKAAERARELVKQILTFSRRSDQQARPLLLQFVVKEALKLIRASIPVNIEIREEIDVSCGAVLADPGQIHQVVMNLCTNAYQAMRETGGVMHVRLQKVMVSKNEAKLNGNLRPGPHVCLEVSDSGCGMEKAVLDRIFEPYFTTKGKQEGEGTGLGLALVHGIVVGLGGGITVTSNLGEGGMALV